FEEDNSKKNLFLDEKDYFVIEYFDFLTLNGDKKVKIKNLGEKFASINSFFFEYLKEYHIPAAFVKNEDKTSLKFIKYKKFPFSIRILNVVDKRMAKIFNKKEGELLSLPVFEIHSGNNKDSLISESHLVAFDLCSTEDFKVINRICSKVNAVLKSFFERRGYLMAETTCNFGKFDEKVFVVDDFTPRSLKVVPLNKDIKIIDPYKFATSVEIRHYTDHLFNLMSA
ncbi:MAG: phosphoribosylaminoimidazolesuccinocarboxamide synthase, partial [Ignavibacteriaceae bacterium]|nr:phosphoribosylaminoimidazolesuccinocarboxamide synthase [Ignavibacteriaceae bacterium]